MSTYLKITGLCLILFFGFACNKKSSGTTATSSFSSNGKIIGKQWPLGQSIIYAVNDSANTIMGDVDNQGIGFVIDSLKSGNYIVNFVTPNISNPSSLQPASLQVQITGGNTINLDTVFMLHPAYTGSATSSFCGAASPQLGCNYRKPNFYLLIHSNPLDRSIAIELNNVHGPGTYLTGSSIQSSIRLVQYSGATWYSAWSTLIGGSGKVNITLIDTTNQLCSGTFTVTAVPENRNATGTQTITNGVFTNVNYNP